MEMSDFYIAPDFPSSHDSGMLAKKLQLKKKLISIMRRIKIKIAKNKKNDTCTGVVFTDL